MNITVMYQNDILDSVASSLIDEMISSKKIKKILRSDGWATIGVDQVRGRSGDVYTGAERRKAFNQLESTIAGDIFHSREVCIADKRKAAISICDFERVFEFAPSLLLLLDQSFRILAVTDAYLQATMSKRGEIIGHDIFEIFPDNPADPGATGVCNLKTSLNRVLKTGKSDTMALQRYDVRQPKEKGGDFEERYWSPVNSPVLGPENEVRYIVHRVEDVTQFVKIRKLETEREKINEEMNARLVQMAVELYSKTEEIAEANLHLKELNEQLEREHSKFKSLVDSVTDEIWLFDANGKVLYMNPSATTNIVVNNFENCSLDELLARREVVNADGSPRQIEEVPLYHCALQGKRIRGEETIRHLKTKELMHREYTASPMRDGMGQIFGAVAVVRDITEHKQLVFNLQQALDEVQHLSGLLPICASCKKIRNNKGYWEEVEAYIQKHSQAVFSHGICPECARKLYPDILK